ncbi:MAG: hypothetical protein OXB86_00145 [Bdellovibrionales bacterium]|nr:hypothetical protein [Bdellovibrionales bacterium]
MKKKTLFILFFISNLITYQFESFSLNQVSPGSATKKTRNPNSKKRIISGKNHFPKNFLWKKVPFFKDSNPTLYYFTENPDIFISVQQEKAVPAKQLINPNLFFKQTEQEKAVTLSETSIKNRRVSFSIIEHFPGTYLFFSRGSYLDFKKTQVFFEEWNFYHDKLSLYILVHYTQTLTEKETQATHSFIYNLVNSIALLTDQEIKQFQALIDKIKNHDY